MLQGPYEHHYSSIAGGKGYWEGTDSLQAFKERVKKHPSADTEYYQKNPIVYKFNNKGFRTPDDFSKGEKGNIFLGCSHTFGTGHYLENTWSSMLSKKVGGKFFNLSVPGSGIGTASRLLRYWINELDVQNIFLYYPHKYRYEFSWRKSHSTYMPHFHESLGFEHSPTLQSVFSDNVQATNYYMSNLYSILYLAKVANVPVYSYITHNIPMNGNNPDAKVKTARDGHMSTGDQFSIYHEMLKLYQEGKVVEDIKDVEKLVERLI